MYKSAGLFGVPPQAIAKASGLHFENDYDDLDYFRAAAVTLASGRHVAFWRYEGSTLGVDLLIDSGDDIAAARSETIAALGLAEVPLIWIPDSGRAEVTNLHTPPTTWEGTGYVILRRDPSALPPSDFVAMEVRWSAVEAEEAVARAEALTRDPHTVYSYQAAPVRRER